MEVLSEQLAAILLVRPRVQDVGMPEVVDRPGRADLPVSVHDVESEKTTIQILDLVLVLGRPAFFFAKLSLEHAEIEPRHAVEGRRYLSVVLQEVLTFIQSRG